MTIKEYQAYLIDFDGTLFNTLDSLKEVYKIGFAAIGESCTDEQVADYIHMSLSECGELRGLSPDRYKVFIAKILSALESPSSLAKVRIYDDVVSTIKGLQKEGKYLAIVSGNTVTHISGILSRYKIESYFNFIIGADPSRRPKPFADPILAALREIPRIPSSEVVYIGDSLQDPECAHNARIDGILLERNHEYPDYVLTKISTLKELLVK
jgi:HAD superfamily hydrolase (TIGR01549 family)